MKYHRLSAVELEPLEAEFVKFLIVQGIDAADWNKLKVNDIEEADLVMDQFSDMVIERSLLNIKYLEIVLDKAIYTFHCQENEITLCAMTIDGESDFSLTNATDMSHIQTMLQEGALKINVFSQTKDYNPDRNTEVYNMLQQKLSISDGKWFAAIQKMVDNRES
jgi:hypothetical protein